VAGDEEEIILGRAAILRRTDVEPPNPEGAVELDDALVLVAALEAIRFFDLHPPEAIGQADAQGNRRRLGLARDGAAETHVKDDVRERQHRRLEQAGGRADGRAIGKDGAHAVLVRPG